MLLRRIKQHVQNENWFAVFVDFVIVVVGVYVGIEVSNWNEQRQEEQRGQQYLQRIKADLENDLQTIANRHNFWTQVLGHGQGAIAHAETGMLVSDSAAKTVLAYFQASQVAPYRAVNVTYQEMVAAGDLNLIESSKLRAEFAEYFVNATDLQETHLFRHIPEYREVLRGLIPYDLQDYIWTNCHRAVGNSQELVDCDLPVEEAAAEEMLSRLVENDEVVRELRFWIGNLKVASNVISINRAKIADLIEQVDTQLARDP